MLGLTQTPGRAEPNRAEPNRGELNRLDTDRIDPDRPDPDALLARLAEKEAPPDRGRLTIYLGAAAGVGKTYSMLEAARQRLSEGVDVVAGWVETHGRAETEALLKGIPAIPPKVVPYRGTTLQEMDLDALLARHPQLALVDELAHTNAPGSRHARRYQDVQELLQAGISVYTTLNIQHVESLNDVVAQITGVIVRETVPDGVLDGADRVELIDLSPEELIQRLREGKVYVPQQAEQALHNFFRLGNLNALRELALRRTAARVDRQLQAYMRTHEITGPWPATERVLVCVGSGPLSEQLVRTARRMAAALQAEWLAVYVENPQAELAEEDRNRIAATLRLAEQLGAETLTVQGEDVAEEILRIATSRNVTQILVGKPARPRWQELLHGSPVDRIVRESGPISVHLVKGEGWPRPAPASGTSPAATSGATPPEALSHLERAARAIGSAAQSQAALRQPSTPPTGAAALRYDELATPASILAANTQLRRPWLPYLYSLAAVALVVALALPLRGLMDPVNLALAFLLPVIWSAIHWGRWPSIVASVAAVLAFDFFFILPYHRLTVAEARYVFSLLVFFGVGLVVSTLASHLRRQVVAAHRHQEDLASLYTLSREVAALTQLDEVANAVARRVATAAQGETILVLPNARGELAVAARALPPTPVPAPASTGTPTPTPMFTPMPPHASVPTPPSTCAAPRPTSTPAPTGAPTPMSTSTRMPSAGVSPGLPPESGVASGELTPWDENEQAVATWVIEHGQPAGLDTDTLTAAEFLYLPLQTTRGIVGVLGVRPRSALRPTQEQNHEGREGRLDALPGFGRNERGFERAGRLLMPDQRRLLDTLAGLAAVAIERVQLAEQASQARVLAESERLRSALLDSVSHGLRTPLSAVIGAATALLEGDGLYDLPARKDLLETIREESLRMNRLVGNLLDMARLEAGSLRLDLDDCDLEDLTGTALGRLKEALRAHPVRTQLPVGLPPVRADFVLMEQVFVNLLDNAAKYSPPGTPIEISARVVPASQLRRSQSPRRLPLQTPQPLQSLPPQVQPQSPQRQAQLPHVSEQWQAPQQPQSLAPQTPQLSPSSQGNVPQQLPVEPSHVSEQWHAQPLPVSEPRQVQPSQWVEVKVADEGPGIPDEDLERVFEKFYRVRRADQPVGTGLGLPICRAIVEAHAGHIWAERNEHGGTTIRFTIPAGEAV